VTALTAETLKRIDSSDQAQREFDAQQLAAAAQRKEADDFEASKRWVDRAKVELFMTARESAIEEHFRAVGHNQGVRVRRRSPGGKHRAVWFLEPYLLPEPVLLDHAPSEAAGPKEPGVIQYDFTPPGEVKAAWYVRLLIGATGFVTRSWRGLLWVAILVVPVAYVLFSMVLALAYTYVERPVRTSDLASLMVIPALAWFMWRVFLRPAIWLLEDRLMPVSELWLSFAEEDAQLELARQEGKRRLQLVRYSAVCPICAGAIQLRYSQGPNHRQLVGCCSEAPHDHLFSFDRIRRVGRRMGTA
jgi:hypothetical protein